MPQVNASSVQGIWGKLFDITGHTFFSIFFKTETRGQGQNDPESVCDTPRPKMYLYTKFWIPTWNVIQICSGLDLSRTEARGQGHRDPETVVDALRPKDVSTYQILEFYAILYRKYAPSRSRPQ